MENKHLLTEHFTLEEFTQSQTAVHHEIYNVPDRAVIDNLHRLCVDILEPLRSMVNLPIVITSGYRCPALNAEVGGVKNSSHLYGLAADIHVGHEYKSYRPWYVADLIVKSDLPFDQCILYYTFVHVSIAAVGNCPRRQFLDFRPDKHC